MEDEDEEEKTKEKKKEEEEKSKPENSKNKKTRDDTPSKLWPDGGWSATLVVWTVNTLRGLETVAFVAHP